MGETAKVVSVTGCLHDRSATRRFMAIRQVLPASICRQ